MRCGAGWAGGGGGAEPGTGSMTAADAGAGLAVKGGDVISGCWDIPNFRSPPSLRPMPMASVRCKQRAGFWTAIQTVTQGAVQGFAQAADDRAFGPIYTNLNDLPASRDRVPRGRYLWRQASTCCHPRK